MIPSLSEIFSSVYGAWRLVCRDPRGMPHFDVSTAGFYRSFFAAVLVLPVYAAAVLLELSHNPVDAEPLRIFLVRGLAYVIGWVAFPVIVYRVCDAMGKNQSYTALIVAFNWSTLIYAPLHLLIALMFYADLGWLAALGDILAFLFLLWVLYYHWFIAKTALQVAGAAAAGIVFTELAIDITIQFMTNGMLH